jgi:hypothetical protein
VPLKVTRPRNLQIDINCPSSSLNIEDYDRLRRMLVGESEKLWPERPDSIIRNSILLPYSSEEVVDWWEDINEVPIVSADEDTLNEKGCDPENRTFLHCSCP